MDGAIDMVEVPNELPPMTWNERQACTWSTFVKWTQWVNENLIYEEELYMKKIIKNGTIVTAADTYRADILIENGEITQIGDESPCTGCRSD